MSMRILLLTAALLTLGGSGTVRAQDTGLPLGSVAPPSTIRRWRALTLTYVFGGVAASITFTKGIGLIEA